MEKVPDNHFHANKTENERETRLQINEAIDQMGEEKVERTQAEDGADVGSVDDKRILGNREHRWNGINRKDKVHHVDDDEGEGQRSQHPAPIDARFEVFAIKLRRNPDPILAQPHHETVPEILFAGLGKKHSDGADDQKKTEEVQDEMKTRDQRDAEQDHDTAHDQSAENSPG